MKKNSVSCFIITATGVISLLWQQMLAQFIHAVLSIYWSPMTQLPIDSNIMYLVHGQEVKKSVNISFGREVRMDVIIGLLVASIRNLTQKASEI